MNSYTSLTGLRTNAPVPGVAKDMWISFIAHLLLFWFLFYGPPSHRIRVVNPSDNIKQKDLTFLNLPPDAEKQVKPPKPAPPSDKNRIAKSAHPTLDRKTLQQLEAMKRAGPPQPVAPQPAAPASSRRLQRSSRRRAVHRLRHPHRPTQQSLLNEPKPAPTAPTRPSFDTGPQTAGDLIRQAERNAAQNPGISSGDYGQNAPSQHQAMEIPGPDILSDTMGVDFGPYMRRVIDAT